MNSHITPNSAARKYLNIVLRALVVLLFAGALVFLLEQDSLKGTVISRYRGSQGHMESGWVMKQGSTVLEENIELPAFRHMEKGKLYSISTTLTYDGSKDNIPCGFFFVDHMFCRVALEGEELFSYMPEDAKKPDRSKSPGNVYVAFELPPDCRGKELVVEFMPSLDADIDYQLPTPCFGNFATVAVATFWSDLPHNVVVILSGIIGIACVLFATFGLKGSQYREGLFIGLFASLFSLYNITESDFDFYIISNPYYTYLLDYTCFTLIPVCLMAFLRERMDRKRQPYALVLIVIGLVMFAAEMVLHFTGVMDMREFLPILHVVYFISFLIIIGLLIASKGNKRKRLLILQMVPILCGLVMDVLIYYLHWQLDTSDSTFTSIGVIFFLLIELYHVWNYSIEVYTESIRSKDYRQMAYVDALTGIGNRRAFDAARHSITTGQEAFRFLIVASVDVNYLKYNNDTYGHAAGDFLIRNAANVLAELSESCGNAYRVGGDEFIVLLYDIDDDEFQQRLTHLQSQVHAINSNSETKLSLAIGYEISSSAADFDATVASADKKMYLDKARIKGDTP